MEKNYFINQLWPVVVFLTFFSFLLGLFYPGLVMFINQLAFSNLANGSLIVEDMLLGSELIGQPFFDDKFFWGRISATTPAYNPQSSTGSNLSPANPQLLHLIKARIAALKKSYPSNTPIPVDLVTASASGLDPHISLASAYYQIPRIARARGIKESVLFELVNATMENRQLGFLGEPRVNVVKLNLALHKADRY